VTLPRTLVPSPRKRGPAKVVLSTYIPPEVSDAVRETAVNEGVTVAAFVTAALEHYLAHPRQVAGSGELTTPHAPVSPREAVEVTPLALVPPPEPVPEPASVPVPVVRPTLAERILTPAPEPAPPSAPKPKLSFSERFRLHKST
jgi:hypothetical protein